MFSIWLKGMREQWKGLVGLAIAVGVLGAAVGIGKESVRWAAGSTVIEERLADVEAGVVEVKEDQERHQILVDMKEIRTRLWNIEDRWAEKFTAQINRIHDSLEELLNFMTPEARRNFKELQVEFEELKDRLDKLDEQEDEDV